jgi:hypothetical protein
LGRDGDDVSQDAENTESARFGRIGVPRPEIDARDYFDEHILPELRVVRRGTRTVLVPVAELVRWVERNAARCSA